MSMKRCAKCKKVKPFAEFNRNRAKQDRLQSDCRDCCNGRTPAEVEPPLFLL